MSDTDTDTDKPIETPVEAAERAIDPPHAVEPKTSIDRLRAFEDETLGADAVRINGRIERGYGSFFQTKLTDKQRAHHAALEKLIDLEQKVDDAKGKLHQAEADLSEAEAAVDAAAVE